MPVERNLNLGEYWEGERPDECSFEGVMEIQKRKDKVKSYRRRIQVLEAHSTGSDRRQSYLPPEEDKLQSLQMLNFYDQKINPKSNLFAQPPNLLFIYCLFSSRFL